MSTLYLLSPTAHRTVLAPFTHTAPHRILHQQGSRLTLIRGTRRGNRCAIRLNCSQLNFRLPPRRFNHFISSFPAAWPKRAVLRGTDRAASPVFTGSRSFEDQDVSLWALGGSLCQKARTEKAGDIRLSGIHPLLQLESNGQALSDEASDGAEAISGQAHGVQSVAVQGEIDASNPGVVDGHLYQDQRPLWLLRSNGQLGGDRFASTSCSKQTTKSSQYRISRAYPAQFFRNRFSNHRSRT